MASGDRQLAAVVLALAAGAFAAGCDRGDSSSASSNSSANSGGAEASRPGGASGARASSGASSATSSGPGKGADADADDAAAAPSDAAPSDASNSAAAPQVPTPDVGLPPSVDGEPSKAGFVFYAAKDKPAALADFHKKDLEAKGWKLGKNRSAALAGTNLAGVVQEYAKGKDQLTIVLTEMAGADGAASMGMVLDMPLPPNKQVIVAFPFVMIDADAAPEETAAWFKKELAARGWTAGREETTGPARVVNFSKTGRSLQAQIRPQGGGKPGSSVQLMHVASGG